MNTSSDNVLPDGRRRINWVSAAAFILLCLVAWMLRPEELGRWALYGIVSFTYLAIKLMASYTHYTEPPTWPRTATVGAIVPAHNEDAHILIRCVDALSMQVDRIVVIDDGSRDDESQRLILNMGRQPNIDVICFDQNRGKRVGLRIGTAHLMAVLDPDYIATVDSDTLAHLGSVNAAVFELEEHPELGATTALVRARNWKKNLLTRLQDLRYANAFLWERAAYSQVGAVLCVCGSFTLWRASVLASSVEQLTSQRFLGRECTYGDDRHLTNLALSNGWKISLCETAVADTLVPETFNHFRRQQTRWSKSFFRESLWALKNLQNGWGKTLTFMEIAAWVIFSLVLLYSLVLRPVLTAEVAIFQILLWVSVMSWARSVRFFDARPEASRFDRAYSFLIAPLYGIIHLLVLLPLRVWAILTLNDTDWGTRSAVEVSEVRTVAVEDSTSTAAASRRRTPDQQASDDAARIGALTERKRAARRATRARRAQGNGQPSDRSRRRPT